jgi:YVTN family beta-propeller protein
MCAYVVIPGNEGITVVDVTSQAKVADIYMGQNPVAAAIDPRGQAIYVVNRGDENALSVLETAAYTVVKKIRLEEECQSVAVSSDSRFAYLTEYYYGSVAVVDLSAGEVVRSIDEGKYRDPPLGFALSSDGARLFTPGPGAFRYIEPTGWEVIASVGIIDTASGRLTDTITLVPNSEEALAVLLSPDEQRAYVALLPPRDVLVLDLASHTVVDQFENVGPFIALSPDGSQLYTVEGSWPDPAVGALAAINVQTKAVRTIPLGTLAVLGRPILAVAPESSLVYVAFDRSPFVFAVDTETQSVVAQVEVAGNPSDIAVGEINGPCRPVNYTPPTSPTPTPTPTVTPTKAPTFQCPPGVPCLEISSASIPAGGEATITVHLMTAGQQIAGIQNDISFDSPIAVHDCSSALSFVGGFYSFDSSLRALFYSPAGSGQTVISDGALLYSCTVTVASDAPLGHYPLVALKVLGSDGRGQAITVASADGEVVVTTSRNAAAPSGISAGASTSTSSGCQIINGPAADSFWLGLVIPMLLLRRGKTEKCISADATIPRWQPDQM